MLENKKLYLSRGFTLFEVLISLVLSLLLLSFIYKIFIINFHGNQIVHSLNKATLDADVIINSLRHDLQQAGHIGCAYLYSDFPIISHNSFRINSANKLEVNNDELTIRYAEFPGANILGQDAQALYVTANIPLKSGDTLLVSDCTHAEIVTIDKIFFMKKFCKIMLKTPLQYTYESIAEISRLIVNHYFYNAARKALFLRNIKNETQELVEDVDDWQVKQQQKIITINFKVSHFPWQLVVALRKPDSFYSLF